MSPGTGLSLDEYFRSKDSGNNVSKLLPDALGSTTGLVGSCPSLRCCSYRKLGLKVGR